LELEWVTVASVAETPATTPYQTTTQDDEGEDEVEEEVPESMKVKAVVPSSSKCKGRGDGSVVYAEVSGLVSIILNYFKMIKYLYALQCDRCKTYKKLPQCIVVANDLRCSKCVHNL
jgi:hypothetical protein